MEKTHDPLDVDFLIIIHGQMAALGAEEVPPFRQLLRHQELLQSRKPTLTGREIEVLRGLDAVRSELIATASHELRTPLNSLLILAGMLEGDTPTRTI